MKTIPAVGAVEVVQDTTEFCRVKYWGLWFKMYIVNSQLVFSWHPSPLRNVRIVGVKTSPVMKNSEK